MPKSDHEKAKIRRATEACRQPEKDRTSHDRARGVKQKRRSRSSRSLSTRISRRDLDESEFQEAINELHNGSDRVAAIMGAALIENNLIGAIKASLQDDFDSNALFVDSSAPYNSFKAKIVAGRSFNLYNDKVFKDLDVIRDVRNQFAHALLSVDFEHPDIAKECDKLGRYDFHLTDESRSVSPHRLKFERACWTISCGLLIVANDRYDDKLRKRKAHGLGALVAKAFGDAWEIPSLNHLVTSRLKGGEDDI